MCIIAIEYFVILFFLFIEGPLTGVLSMNDGSRLLGYVANTRLGIRPRYAPTGSSILFISYENLPRRFQIL